MNLLDLIVVEVKAFVPARDFALSMAFYQALGVTRASVFDDSAYFHCGESSFLMQDFFVREHAENFQMHLLVENVDAWHEKATAVPGQDRRTARSAVGDARLHAVRSERGAVANRSKHSEAGRDVRLFNELFAIEADLARRICSLRFTLSWPELGVRVGSRSGGRASSASA